VFFLSTQIQSRERDKRKFAILGQGPDRTFVPLFRFVLVPSYRPLANIFCISWPIVPCTCYSYHSSSFEEALPCLALNAVPPNALPCGSLLRSVGPPEQAVGKPARNPATSARVGFTSTSEKMWKEGSPVEILLTLPNEITLAGPVRVRCLGRVQRTESRDETSVGVVAAIERYEFLRGEEEK